MAVYKTLSDSELIALLTEGNHHAYTEIYNRYFYLMFVFAYKKLRDEDLAKDFVQELFTSVWHKRATLSTQGNFGAFLYIALRHKIFDYFIHQKVASKYVTFLKDYQLNVSNENADDLIRDNQLKLYIAKQIEGLPTKMRKIFELSRKENLTYKEIAKELSLSEKTVHSQMVNALNRLRTKLNFFIYFIF